MFVPCPHCQFLIACPPQRRAPLAADCPRCGRALEAEPAATTAHTEAGIRVPTHAPAPTNPSAQSAMLRALGGGLAEVAEVPDATDADDAADATPASGAVEDGEPAVTDRCTETATVAAVDIDIDIDMDADADASGPEQAPALVTDPVPESIPAQAAPDSLPATLTARKRSPLWQRLRWPLIAVLAVLLGLQMLLADRARLAADPAWRPLLENLCSALGCTLPAWHEPAAFTMLDRQVRPAAQAGALRVDATFRNDARWVQDWPALQLALSDADGHVLGSKVFAPADYLGAAPTPQLLPGQSAQVSFQIQEPAAGTVAFSFEFR